MSTDQAAIVRELLKRRNELDPERGAIVDELAKRMSISTGENVQARVTSGGETISDTAEPGYWEQVGSRLKEQFFPDRTVSLPEAIGLDALMKQYGLDALKQDFSDIKEGKRTISQVIVDKIPFFGPSLNEAIKASAEGKPKTAAAILTTDIGVPAAIGGVIGRAGKAAPALERSAAKSYTRILEPTAKRNVPVAENLAGKLAEEKIVASSRNALQTKAKAGMAEWGPKAGAAFQNAQPIAFNDAFAAIENLKDKHLYVKGTKTVPANRAGLQKFFDGVQEDLLNLADAQGNIPAQIVDNYIDDINKGLVGANQEYRTQVPPRSLAQMQKSAARALRVTLDTPNASAAAINSTYSMYARLNEFLEDSRRKRITARSGITTGSSKGFGALLERSLPRFVREIPKDIAGVFDSVPWNTVAGAVKQSLAEALAQQNWKRARWIIRVPLAVSVANAARRNPQTTGQLAPEANSP